MYYLILLRSITVAQRAARLLQRSGIYASVIKAPQRANPRGCTNGVRVSAHHYAQAIHILRERNIQTGKVFSVAADGALTEVEV